MVFIGILKAFLFWYWLIGTIVACGFVIYDYENLSIRDALKLAARVYLQWPIVIGKYILDEAQILRKKYLNF